MSQRQSHLKRSKSSSPTLAIVVPCYNEEEALPHSLKVLKQKIKELKQDKKISSHSFILFVDDGSDDKTWSMIEKENEDNLICGLRLSANVGHQNALLAGLHQVNGMCDAVISIDADLQDDVNAIDTMLQKYQEGEHIVLGVRKCRKSDSFFKRLTAQLYYGLLQCMKIHATFNHADYRLLSSTALAHLCLFPEQNLFLRALPKLLHRRIAIAEYDRSPRIAGESKYPFSKMLALAWVGITSFSALPLRFITVLGTLISILSIMASIFVLWAYFAGKTVPGWASITLPMYVLGGLLMLSLGVIGEYIAKIFIEVKARPRFLIEALHNIEPDQK